MNGNPTTLVPLRVKKKFLTGKNILLQISCSEIQGQDRLLVEIIRNGTEEGTYTISFKNEEGNHIIISDDKALVCTGDEFTIGLEINNNYIHSDATVKWTTNNITLSNYTGISTTITGFSPAATGIVYSVTATITLNGCKQVLTKTFEGTEDTFPDFEIVETFPACYGIANGFGSYVTSPPTHVLWTVDYGTINDFSGNPEGILAIVNPILNTNKNFTLTATFTNECANQKSVSKTFFPEVCEQVFFRLSVSPNPTSNILTVKIEDEAINGEYQVIINDQLASIKYQNTVSIKEFQIDVSKYRDGVYFLRVYGENYSESLKFIVSHID